MRTTLDLDDALVSQARARFPLGTSKTVVLEEALRVFLRVGAPDERPAGLRTLIAEGLVTPSTHRGAVLGSDPTGITLSQLLADLAADREDR